MVLGSVQAPPEHALPQHWTLDVHAPASWVHFPAVEQVLD